MTYEEVLPSIKARFPEWWEEHLAWCSEIDIPHVAVGILVGRIGRAMYEGDRSYAKTAADFGNALASSKDERVDNLVYVSFFEGFHQVHPDDRDLIAQHLTARAKSILGMMTEDIQDHYVIQGIKDADKRPI